jgi:tryptophan synthase alpha chain
MTTSNDTPGIATAHGVSAIAETFARAKSEQRATFMPYWMIGYPDLPTSIAIVNALIDAGADIIELGIPFSDPLADGAANQVAAQIALDNHTTSDVCFEAVRTIRRTHSQTPLLLMGYFNPMLAYGLDRYVTNAADAGADGFVVPDLPPEESHELLRFADPHQLALIEMLAPTSSPDRIKLVADTAKGFIYLVSVTGVTGAREPVAADLSALVKRVRQATDLPLSVGFGINRPEQAHQVAQIADGVIVGSALIKAGASGTNEERIESVRTLAVALRGAC